ncbi:MAG: alpha/beta hydrolase [Ruminococcus sp.]|nr:alpha/beta hydrolase [Candidatus Apopatosoma intestinale]
MESKVYTLREDDAEITLTSYIASATEELSFNQKRKAILVIPGGAYWMVSDREGEPIAYSFLNAGFNAFVLKYTVRGKRRFPAQLLEVSMAMKLIHEHAEEFHIDPDYIFTIGFSAGGHLCASHGTMWNRDFIFESVDMPREWNRPRGMILGYPVITSGEKAHRGSIDNLLGEKKEDPEALETVSLEKQVTEDTPPTFLLHARNDTCVPVENTLLFATALAAHKIPFEMHVYPVGGHGFSLASPLVGVEKAYPSLPGWIDLAIQWAKTV